MSRAAIALAGALLLPGCVGVPGGTPEEERAHVDAFAEETLEDLRRDSPEIGESLDACVAYAAVRMRSIKVPVFGWGGGWGVLVDRRTGERTYLEVRRVDFGAGWGARVERITVILRSEDALADFEDGGFDFGVSGSAGAGVGGSGGDAGGSAGPGREDALVHVQLETGASATATAFALRWSPYARLGRGAETPVSSTEPSDD